VQHGHWFFSQNVSVLSLSDLLRSRWTPTRRLIVHQREGAIDTIPRDPPVMILCKHSISATSDFALGVVQIFPVFAALDDSKNRLLQCVALSFCRNERDSWELFSRRPISRPDHNDRRTECVGSALETSSTLKYHQPLQCEARLGFVRGPA
jgi:hypothetical protein